MTRYDLIDGTSAANKESRVLDDAQEELLLDTTHISETESTLSLNECISDQVNTTSLFRATADDPDHPDTSEAIGRKLLQLIASGASTSAVRWFINRHEMKYNLNYHHLGHLSVDPEDILVSPVALAASTGAVTTLAYLLSISSVDVNIVDPTHGFSALHLAALLGQTRSAQLLICDLRIDINLRTYKDLKTALHLAIEGNNVDIVQALLSRSDLSVTLKDGRGNTALHLAAKALSPTIVRAVLNKMPGGELLSAAASRASIERSHLLSTNADRETPLGIVQRLLDRLSSSTRRGSNDILLQDRAEECQELLERALANSTQRTYISLGAPPSPDDGQMSENSSQMSGDGNDRQFGAWSFSTEAKLHSPLCGDA